MSNDQVGSEPLQDPLQGLSSVLEFSFFDFIVLPLLIVFCLLTVRVIFCPLKKTCLVIVLGDIGRSPRMQNHVQMLSENGFTVRMAGYLDTYPKEAIQNDKNVKLSKILPPPNIYESLPHLLSYPLKTMWLFAQLLLLLLTSGLRYRIVLVQNPPSIPTLLIQPICLILRKKFIVDFHNYGYTILNMKIRNESHPLVQLNKFVESFVGRLSSATFCVSKAMKDDLKNRFSIKDSLVLYDKPPSEFRPMTDDDRFVFLEELSESYQEFGDVLDGAMLLVSSTSWTEDEKMDVLIEALHKYESKHFPLQHDIICVITGKGPLKRKHQSMIKQYTWKGTVKIICPWLTYQSYVKLLGSADLGVCMHTSSSGVDLPMKVVDMLGCGLPVLAYDYPAITELVTDRAVDNGCALFTDADSLLDGIVASSKRTFDANRNMKCRRLSQWSEEWKRVALPIFESFSG